MYILLLKLNCFSKSLSHNAVSCHLQLSLFLWLLMNSNLIRWEICGRRNSQDLLIQNLFNGYQYFVYCWGFRILCNYDSTSEICIFHGIITLLVKHASPTLSFIPSVVILQYNIFNSAHYYTSINRPTLVNSDFFLVIPFTREWNNFLQTLWNIFNISTFFPFWNS